MLPIGSIDDGEGQGYPPSLVRFPGGFVRAICVILTTGLATGCASSAVGAWKAGAGAASGSAAVGVESRGLRQDDGGRGRPNDADEVVGCLVQAVVIGGVAAVIYLTRFRGSGGGGGGDGAPAEPPLSGVAETESAVPMPDWALPRRPPEGAGSMDVAVPRPDRVLPRLSREAEAIVEADTGVVFRPCGPICAGTPVPATR